MTFTGALPARDAFSLGRVMVVPSRAESFPYIVLEAAAAGLPLIATDVGGIPEIVAGTDTALIPPGDVAALSDAIHASARRSARSARARAAAAEQNVGAKFTVDGMADAVLDFYARTAALTMFAHRLRAAQLPVNRVLGTDSCLLPAHSSFDNKRSSRCVYVSCPSTFTDRQRHRAVRGRSEASRSGTRQRAAG